MEAKEKSLTFLREQVVYIVPYFQRGYVWKEENWTGIWDELTADRRDCFLGSIILKKDKIPGREGTYKTIIDGQQRLTTLTILLRAFYDYHIINNASDITLHQFRVLLFHPVSEWLETGVLTKEVYRIEHSRLNREDYQNIMDGKVNVSDIVMDGPADKISNPLLRCYRFFTEKIANAPDTELKRVQQKLMFDTSKILVVIDLDEEDNEQLIFDTINSTGVKLTAADIIKNALFHKVKKAGYSEEDIYKNTWENCFENEAETSSLWLETKGLGQNQRSNIDHFFYSYAIVKGIFSVPGDKMANLAEKYKDHINKMPNAEIIDFIKSICSYANTYRDTFIQFDDVTTYTYSDSAVRLLHILNTVKITAFDPFILHVFASSDYDDEKRAALFNQLECYVMRHYVIGNTSKMGSFLQDAVEFIDKPEKLEEKLTDDLISDVRLEHALRDINNTKAKLVLFWIELRRHTRKESDLYHTPLTYAYELEHIMPQKWEKHWGFGVQPIIDENGEKLPDDEATRIRNEAVYEIGNMTLLSSKLNKELQNYNFKDKVKGAVIKNRLKPGMELFASLSITKEVINRNPLVWNEKLIRERTKQLTEEFKEIWPYSKPAASIAERI